MKIREFLLQQGVICTELVFDGPKFLHAILFIDSCNR